MRLITEGPTVFNRISLHSHASVLPFSRKRGSCEARESQQEERAEVADLADALGSGSSEGNLLGVQIPPSAPFNPP